MKTQILKQQIRIALATAIVLAVFTTTTNAQRRDSDENNRTTKRTEQPAKYKSKSADEKKVTYRRPVENNKAEANRNNKYDKHDSYKHHDKKHKDEWRKDKHYHRNYDRHNDVHVHLNPPVYHWDIHPHPHISFRKLPRKAIWVFLDGENYFVHRGRFYMSSPFGYYRVKPPKYIQTLPNGCDSIWVKGRQVFDYHGVLFINTPLGFKIIAS